MEDKKKAKSKFIIAEVFFTITIGICLLKIPEDFEGFKWLLGWLIPIFLVATAVNVIWYLVGTRIIHRKRDK